MVQYMQLYGGRIFLLIILSIVTIFRREISCNRVYGKEEEEEKEKNNVYDDDEDAVQQLSIPVSSSVDEDIPILALPNSIIADSPKDDHHSSVRVKMKAMTIAVIMKWMESTILFSIHKNPKKEQTHTSFYWNIFIWLLLRLHILQPQENDESKKEKEEADCKKYLKSPTPREILTPPPLHFLTLPQDLHIHIFTFLHPRDILQLSLCNTKTYTLIHKEDEEVRDDDDDYDSSTSSTATKLWFTLWKRDYACVVKDWDVGQGAIQRSISFMKQQETYKRSRSSCTSTTCPTFVATYLQVQSEDSKKKATRSTKTTKTTNYTMKDFYFYFGQTWINYTIAGHCTMESCFVGLHGHVFNLIPFITSHPGSPETLLMLGGGRDATKIFESLGHSSTARKVATQQLLIIQDASCMDRWISQDSWGLCLYPEKKDKRNISNVLPPSKSMTHFTHHPTLLSSPSSSSSLLMDPNSWTTNTISSTVTTTTTNRRVMTTPPLTTATTTCRTCPRKPGCTWYYKHKIQIEEIKALSKANSYWMMGKEEQSSMVGPIQVYFDPICNGWMGWYIDSNFIPVFLGMLR